MCKLMLRSESPSGMCAKLRTVAASNNGDHMPQSPYYCSFAPHIYGVVLRTHSVRDEPCIQCNTSREVATTSPPFCNKPHWSHILFVKVFTQHDLCILVTAPFLLWSESPTSMCAKLRTVAASNNRDHMPRSLRYCDHFIIVRATYIWCCSSHTFRSWWTEHSAQRQQRGCNTDVLFC